MPAQRRDAERGERDDTATAALGVVVVQDATAPLRLLNVIRPRRKLSMYDKYEAHVRLYLVPMLGAKRLEPLSVSDVRRFLVRLEQGRTYRTRLSRSRSDQRRPTISPRRRPMAMASTKAA
ncbi:hypothetical protein [Streptomyces sp. PanSC9]|uniref:hypothetical protein n=1 Tax=Streptomyces sp. PanSC9 TaxID=1520461 RepID=UPI0037DA50BF